MKLRKLSWAQFDAAVDELSRDARKMGSALYGIPRGGLVLAVALSHRTGMPLATQLAPGVVAVDDIMDSGATLRDLSVSHAITWFARVRTPPPCSLLCAEVVQAGVWLVFPWEDMSKATADMESYIAAS